jgi:hypothetical protein
LQPTLENGVIAFDNMAPETTPNPELQTSEAGAKPAAAKKAKAPAIEDKPFAEFIQEHFLPGLQDALTKLGLENLALTFTQAPLPLAGATSSEKIWQVKGNWYNGKRQFYLYFLDEDINGKKFFACATDGEKPSTIESFMIDERKVTLDLLILYALQRLNGQKWLVRN